MQFFKASPKYEVEASEKLGRYAVASKDLKAGEKILSDEPFLLGPTTDSSLVCFNCYLPLISKFVACKNCAVAPVCPGDGCPEPMLHKKWHSEAECDLFRTLKLTKGLHPMTMVQNVGCLSTLRAILKRKSDPEGWEEFLKLEGHLDKRIGTSVWEFHENTVKFIDSLGLLEGPIDADFIQKTCAIIDVNSFEVRGPLVPAIGVAEVLRGVYLKAALLAHDCSATTHMSINDNNLLVCHASVDIKKGDTIYNNYTDPLKGTSIRQQHLQIGKYFLCSCTRCSDITELGTYMSSVLCTSCKTGYVSNTGEEWACHSCDMKFEPSGFSKKVQMCIDKFGVINKKDEKELEEFIRNVSLVLAPNHYVLLDAKQRLAGVLRDTINREPRPTKKLMRRKMELCSEIMPVLDKLCPGISRTKAITLYELHVAKVQLAKKLFDGRELTGSAYMDELLSAEKYLKRSLEMLFLEPGNSPEGELCSKALEEYRALKATMGSVLDGMHADGKVYITEITESEEISVN